MKIEEWKDIIEGMKKATEKQTKDLEKELSFIIDEDILGVCRINIERESRCPTCDVLEFNTITVKFHKQVLDLTISQMVTLYLICTESRKSYYYSSFHTSKAGIKFIENIKDLDY